MKFLRILPCIFLLFLFAFSVSIPVTHAQSSLAGIGLRPAKIEGAPIPGDVQTYKVGITNLSAVRQTYYLFLRDISGVKPGGVPIFAEENAEKSGYELTEWVTLDTTEIILDPAEEKEINVTIAVPLNATPGSHFGGIFVSMVPPKMRSSGASVGYEVANIISMRVAGDAIENMQIRSFSSDNFIYSKPEVIFTVRVENKGSVLGEPFGPLEIYNMFGKRVALQTINDTKAGVFPMSERSFDLTWKDEGPGFGRYQARVSMVYGDQGRQSISSTASFWILPMNIILPALGVLAMLLLFAYIFVKLYIRNTLRGMSTSGTRRVVRRRQKSGMSALLLVTVVLLGVTAIFLLILLALFA